MYSFTLSGVPSSLATKIWRSEGSLRMRVATHDAGRSLLSVRVTVVRISAGSRRASAIWSVTCSTMWSPGLRPLMWLCVIR